MPSEPRVPLPMSSFSRRSSNITLSVSPTLSASSVSNVLYTNNQVTLQQRPKKLSLEVTSSSSSTSSRRNSTSTSTGANVRRCHSVRVTGTRTQSFASLNGVNYSPSLKSRRVSSSVLYDKQIDIDYATYDKYKISRANPDSLVNLVIDDTITPGNNVHRIIVLGSAGSGKSTIISSFKFQLEEQRSANNSPKCTNVTKSKTNNNEIILHFCEVEITTCNQDNLSYYQPDAYLVMYSVSDRESFQLACHTLANIQKCQSSDHKPVILVANKSDLVRSRCISKQGELFSFYHLIVTNFLFFHFIICTHI